MFHLSVRFFIVGLVERSKLRPFYLLHEKGDFLFFFQSLAEFSLII